jgi:hypothetical protein
MTYHRRALAAAALAFLVAGCGQPDAVFTEPASAPVQTTPPPAEPSDEPTVQITPKPSHFHISIRTLKKACFGSAGCNVTYQINPAYVGPALGDDQTVTVTYEVRGGDDPQINSFELEGTRASFSEEEFISTPSSSSKLRAVVTDVF